MKHLNTFIGKIFRLLERSNEFINSMAKGMIVGNVLISNGGGVWIEEALLGEQS